MVPQLRPLWQGTCSPNMEPTYFSGGVFLLSAHASGSRFDDFCRCFWSAKKKSTSLLPRRSSITSPALCRTHLPPDNPFPPWDLAVTMPDQATSNQHWTDLDRGTSTMAPQRFGANRQKSCQYWAHRQCVAHGVLDFGYIEAHYPGTLGSLLQGALSEILAQMSWRSWSFLLL